MLVAVEARCAAESCPAGCEVRVAVAKVAVSAANLAHELAAGDARGVAA
ncbi:MAG: hypothetical protein ACYCS9_05845 [Candidatus Dormibacteria bacterium]